MSQFVEDYIPRLNAKVKRELKALELVNNIGFTDEENAQTNKIRYVLSEQAEHLATWMRIHPDAALGVINALEAVESGRLNGLGGDADNQVDKLKEAVNTEFAWLGVFNLNTSFNTRAEKLMHGSYYVGVVSALQHLSEEEVTQLVSNPHVPSDALVVKLDHAGLDRIANYQDPFGLGRLVDEDVYDNDKLFELRYDPEQQLRQPEQAQALDDVPNPSYLQLRDLFAQYLKNPANLEVAQQFLGYQNTDPDLGVEPT